MAELKARSFDKYVCKPMHINFNNNLATLLFHLNKRLDFLKKKKNQQLQYRVAWHGKQSGETTNKKSNSSHLCRLKESRELSYLDFLHSTKKWHFFISSRFHPD